MNKIHWFYCRLKAMSLFEIMYRINEKIKKKKYKKLFKYKKNIIQSDDINIKNIEKLNDRLDKVFHIIDLEDVQFNTYIDIYGDYIELSNKINWHITKKGKEWSKEVSSFDIDFKNKDDLGELRYTWEINRHLFFSSLAMQSIYNNDENAYLILKKHFYNWIEENPFLHGVNWMSPMEISIRSYQWLITYSIIKDKAEKEFKEDILKAIINSIEYVANNFSKYSSANNHLIIEAAITSIIGYCLYPIYKQNWFQQGYNILSKEIPIQVYSDGVNKEQATHYHSFVLDMVLQYNVFLKKINYETIHEELIFKMAEFIGYLYNCGNTVEFGDSDDAKLLDLDGNKKNYYKFVLQLASLYYKKQLIDINNIYLEVKFLTQGLYLKSEYIPKHQYSNMKVYSQGGYCLINNNKNFLLFDVGQLGFGSISAHGHADALSLIYYSDNNPIFVDAGTYIYNVEQKWRNYFRETENHNTLYVENKSQSKMEGPFLWSKKAKSYLIDSGENKDTMYFSAKHDGYFPDIHQRNISYLKNDSIIVVEDSFSGNGILNYLIDKSVEINKINDNLIRLNEVYFYSTSKIEIVEKYISKSFLNKEKTKALKIPIDFKINKQNYCLISKEPIEFKDNEIILDKKTYEYVKYSDIRGEVIENC